MSHLQQLLTIIKHNQTPNCNIFKLTHYKPIQCHKICWDKLLHYNRNCYRGSDCTCNNGNWSHAFIFI